ncbi:uncharacterized protein V1518DRAFT_438369 [Limtongia smithiae]|uniref:uncharacterized protein n=1 Tax=Limtongia smithiae TaxID=1125753 RepID=UPI0034CE5314
MTGTEIQRRTITAVRPIILPRFISISNLARLLNVRQQSLVRTMSKMGFEALSFDHILDYETSCLIAMEYDFEPKSGQVRDVFPDPSPASMDGVPNRPAFVTIMGHVDHGKTTILDYLRKSSIAASEHGGITQHIGAFSVSLSSGKQITFLDTPGHAAFLKMRQRGANITDIVVLVVAADDSVMPQTIEAIDHARKAKVPIDKPNADVDKVHQDLARHDIFVEGYGGDVQAVPVSGLTGYGIDNLEEAILTLAEILDIKADATGKVEGWVIESKKSKGRGNVATMLVRRGTVKPGAFLVAGTTYCKVRSIRDDLGKNVKSASPGHPIEIDGWKELPEAGDEVLTVDSEQHAKSVSDYRTERQEEERTIQGLEGINERRRADREAHTAASEKEKSETGSSRVAVGQKEFLIDVNTDSMKYKNFVLKADVKGSLEAIEDMISAIGNDTVKGRILASETAIGPPTESDIMLASVSEADIVCFNVKPPKEISQLAEAQNVKILTHTIIYHLLEEVKDRVSELLEPVVVKTVLGEAAIRSIFEITLKTSTLRVAGCRVSSGAAKRNLPVRVMRNGNEVFEGTLDTLKQGKFDASEIAKGAECGLTFKNWDSFKEGDVVQFYEQTTEMPEL